MATIAFRTTAGKQIGFGHLRRCLTLAGELRRAGGASSPIGFWVDSDPAAVAVAAAAGFEARTTAKLPDPCRMPNPPPSCEPDANVIVHFRISGSDATDTVPGYPLSWAFRARSSVVPAG